MKRTTIKELKDSFSRELTLTKLKPSIESSNHNTAVDHQQNKRNVLVEQTKTNLLTHANVSVNFLRYVELNLIRIKHNKLSLQYCSVSMNILMN